MEKSAGGRDGAASARVSVGGGARSCGAAAAEETIVFVRHGEKPAAGLGQLDCRGLNRSLELPAVINAMFGKP
ncbi:MAG TPA: hypothetical protein VJY34_18125, partial [Roseiarcus sp.]|nr:hypothetical protein [Roseiarcus sp.]